MKKGYENHLLGSAGYTVLYADCMLFSTTNSMQRLPQRRIPPQRLSLLQPHALATTITPSLRAKQLQYIYQACAKGLLAPSKHFAYAATAYIVQNYSFIITTSILTTTYDQ